MTKQIVCGKGYTCPNCGKYHRTSTICNCKKSPKEIKFLINCSFKHNYNPGEARGHIDIPSFALIIKVNDDVVDFKDAILKQLEELNYRKVYLRSFTAQKL